MEKNQVFDLNQTNPDQNMIEELIVRHSTSKLPENCENVTLMSQTSLYRDYRTMYFRRYH